MRAEDEVVISKGQWEDYMAYDLFSIFVDGFDFNIKIETKNIKKFEAFIETKKKQGARDFFDYIKKLQPKDLVISTTNNEVGYFVMRKDLKNYLKNTERWSSPKNTIKKHELNKSLRSDKK